MVDSINYSHSHADGFTSEGSVVEDKLFDNFHVRRKVTIPSGAGALARGTLLGKITRGARTAVGAAGSPAPAGATITASPVATTAADEGVHRFRCVSAGATGKWDHLSPSGAKLGQATTGTQYVGGGLTLTITDAGTDPAVNEELIVTVTAAAASGAFVKSIAAATDGSQDPRAVLLHAVDATSADVEAIVGRAGTCSPAGMTFGAGHTAASVDDVLIDRGIFLKNTIG